MNIIFKISLISGTALLFIGCGQPEFNPNSQSIAFIKGKPYRIPHGANYNDSRLIGADKKFGKELRSIGIPCQDNYALWQTPEFNKKWNSHLNAGRAELHSIFKQGFAERKVGCSRPLSKQEYQYYRGKENQQSANQRARMQYDAVTAPKTVNLTGTVYHYGL